MADEHRRAAVAERAARAGGVVAREDFRTNLPVETKADKNDLVTRADRDAQQQVLATILNEFPGDAVVCEEEVRPPVGIDADEGGLDVRETVPERGDAWIVDPIDGTANFVRGVPVWTTAVAAVVDGDPVGSAVYFPVLGEIYTAGPDSVTRDGDTLHVSTREDAETFAVGLLGRWIHSDDDAFSTLCHDVGTRFGDVRRFGSMQAALAYVACGGLDAAIMPTPPLPWDAVAGVHLIERSGGTATDRYGDPWTSDGEGLVVSNGTAHEDVLAVLQSQLSDA
ncbi:MAG: inositol monophosphatase [Haloarculaceae archaeon]